jgi:hypothetical protein
MPGKKQSPPMTYRKYSSKRFKNRLLSNFFNIFLTFIH